MPGPNKNFESIKAGSALIASELGLPEYDDVSNAPQTQSTLVYATGSGTSTEGIYKHDGSSYAQVGGQSRDIVDAYPSSDLSLSSGTWATVPYDTENTDDANEFDTTNNQFSPDSDGWYLVVAAALFLIGSDGDLIRLRLRNVTDSTDVMFLSREVGGLNAQTLTGATVHKFLSSKNYEVQALNNDSSDTVQANEDETRFHSVSLP